MPLRSFVFAVEEHYYNSFAPVVVPYISCLAVPVEHILGRLEAADTDIAGAVVETTGMIVLSMPLADTDVEPVAPVIDLTALGIASTALNTELAALGPE